MGPSRRIAGVDVTVAGENQSYAIPDRIDIHTDKGTGFKSSGHLKSSRCAAGTEFANNQVRRTGDGERRKESVRGDEAPYH